MNLFLLEDTNQAQICRQMILLNGECASLQWSRTIQDVPANVSEALETVQDFLKGRIEAICGTAAQTVELSEAQEQALFAAFKTSRELKELLGSGVVLAGEESEIVQRELLSVPELRAVKDALGLGKHLVLF